MLCGNNQIIVLEASVLYFLDETILYYYTYIYTMTSGQPLTTEQKEYIIENKDAKSIGQISKKLDLNHKTISSFLNKTQPKF